RAQDAEDLVADTFLRLIEKGERLEWRDERSFTAWLFRIAHNLVNDYYRRSGQRADNVPLDMLPELSANTLLPDDVLLKQELFARLRLLIGALSPRRQEVITLKFFGGLRNQEIAEILGLDERTVASHLCRGLEDLHRRYIDSGVRKDEAW
ncbi:MAG TPA: sigma-70 family RNA polymerase sigma factor, partial [Ardenticatenaceae bacterium]|nr:sigma-70 family RNA polymerase sigma factor [Ardenticatenaceae bacterium]